MHGSFTRTLRCFPFLSRPQRSIHFSRFLSSETKINSFRNKVNSGPSLSDFIAGGQDGQEPYVARRNQLPPYIPPEALDGSNTKVLFETYGCQMNVNDTEIASKILQEYNYGITKSLSDADVVLIMTCSIREGAEDRIWHRLRELKKRKKLHKVKQVGILGCMAERLKTKLLEKERLVDIIAGPDSYRDLPNLLAINRLTSKNAVNVLLSMDETYSDVLPTVVCDSDEVSLNSASSEQLLTSKKAFVSIMRGCENMCSYCIVPYTRGKERSRSITSIVEEVSLLSKAGVKEVTLLGQNVNSYRDKSTKDPELTTDYIQLAPGFKTIYKPKTGGVRFHTLLRQVAQVDNEMRIRFTSPHPKDFPPEVIQVISEYNNLCKCIHLPAQSGSDVILGKMRRGYTKEAYLNLVKDIRDKLPNVALTSDFICGYCGETEEDHQETLDLIDKVKYNYVYVFAYSMREKTHAYHKHVDDVPQEVKNRRVSEVAELFHRNALKLNQKRIGEEQLVLVEGRSKRSNQDLVGRNDQNIKVIFPDIKTETVDGLMRQVLPGNYVVVRIEDCTSQTLKGTPVQLTTHERFYDNSKE